MPVQGAEEQLREEFNRWAEAGRGEDMEQEHLPITLRTLALMDVQADDRVLDVGCGAGWLPRLIARRVRQEQVVGVDVSDAMIRRAALASRPVQEPGVSGGRGGPHPLGRWILRQGHFG